ncbi:hypothetical protein SR70_04845 [Klebsiella aerogenes]|uniref:hypothetical protein n=1 Tax=Klebsiella aerogenes TaxID=548 RepID=UPI0005EEB127|nr:hypothetical protein [Klebsiella aerogenes]KJP43598.1 hypothetical protein SR70_04845 [Klebsiella aerogenes]
MGSVVKKLVGGSSKKESTTQTSNGTQSNFLYGNKDYMGNVNQGIKEGSNMNIPDYQLAGMPEEQKAALDKLMQGQDYSGYKTAQDFMQGNGSSMYQQGKGTLNQSTDILSRLQNLSQSDYQSMLKGEMNNDLVNEQIAGMKTDVNDWYLGQSHSLDQQATTSGNMGSSRAGVAQGVLGGQAAKAIATGSTQYRTAEEQNAQNRLMSYLNLQGNTAGQLAGIGQNQMNTGLGMYNSGMGYYTQYNQGLLQNNQNAVNAGNIVRNYNQQQLDVNRQNNLNSQSPSLARLAYMNQSLLPISQFSTTSNGTSTTSQNVNQPGMLGSLMSMGGMVAGYYGGGGSSASAAQQGTNMQMGGVMGGMAGNLISAF